MNSVRKKYQKLKRDQKRAKFEVEFSRGIGRIAGVVECVLKRAEADGLIIREKPEVKCINDMMKVKIKYLVAMKPIPVKLEFKTFP